MKLTIDLPNHAAPRKELERRNTVLKSATAEMTHAEGAWKKYNGGHAAKQPFADDWNEDAEIRKEG